MRGCSNNDCLNHDVTKPLNCWEYGRATRRGDGCDQFVSAAGLMRTFRPGCHKSARGRWVSVRTTVFR